MPRRINPFTNVWLTSNLRAASSNVIHPSCPLNPSIRCVCRKLTTRETRQLFPWPVVNPRRFRTPAIILSSHTLANSRTNSTTSPLAIRRCIPVLLRATRNSVCTPPAQWICKRCSASTLLTTISSITVRKIRFFNSTAACASSHNLLKSLPISNNRRFCSSLTGAVCVLALATDPPVQPPGPKPRSSALPAQPPLSGSRVPLDQTVALLAWPHSVPAPTPVPRNAFSLDPPTRPARSLEAPLQFRPAQSLRALPPLPPHLFVDFPPINMNSIPRSSLAPQQL